MSKIIRFIRNPKPYFLVMPYKIYGFYLLIWFYRRFLLPYLIRRTQRKRKINIVFMAMCVDMWRYDCVYRRFENDKRFNPIIVTAMRKNVDLKVRLEDQDTMVRYFRNRGYNVVPGYDEATKRWIDIKKLTPDVIFYTQPYDGAIERSLEYLHHLDALLCYSPYMSLLSDASWVWNNNLQQYCWKLFYISESDLKICECKSRIGKRNAVASGYCFDEEYSECKKNSFAGNLIWRNDSRKRIIWAPHHSILEKEMFKVSSFLELSDFMIKLRDEYKTKVIFAFKPHPALRRKLNFVWGKEKTDLYYDNWSKAENSFYTFGDYHSLFAGSDAMIHCCGSFAVEYLCTGKPVQYVYSSSRNPPDIGMIGDAALSAHYSAHKKDDIRDFVEDIVIGGNDTMRSARDAVVREYIRPVDGKTFSSVVYSSIVDGLVL